jgi:KaiC/GvpD/RAD55 family RecA-like ATPase
MPERYEFEGLPLAGLRPGTSVLVSGPSHAGTRTLGFRMLSGPDDDGAILVSTNHRAGSIAEDWARAGFDLSEERTAVLDCVGEEDETVPAKVLPVSGPADLTGIGMRYSDVYRTFKQSGVERVRTGLFSVSTLLSYGDLKTVSRFVHTLVGRVNAVDGLGVFLVDAGMHDEQTVSTLTQFCSARIDVRETEGGQELRARGVPSQSRDWVPFDVTD